MSSASPGSLHADAVQVLDGWHAPDPVQSGLRDEFLRHLDRYPDGTWRECVPGHITASALVLDDARERALLTLHGKIGIWLQLGGHCEPQDASLAGAALREATEESGIAGLRLQPEPVQLDRHKVRCHPEGSWHLDVQYVALAPAGAEPVISDESEDLRWFRLDALPERTDDAVRRLASRAAAVTA
jgi:8-oxo-dGTP pyrophosphatase MutT (NUDIX family)